MTGYPLLQGTVATSHSLLMVIILTNNRMFYANILNLLKPNLTLVFLNFLTEGLPMSFVYHEA